MRIGNDLCFIYVVFIMCAMLQMTISPSLSLSLFHKFQTQPMFMAFQLSCQPGQMSNVNKMN